MHAKQSNASPDQRPRTARGGLLRLLGRWLGIGMFTYLGIVILMMIFERSLIFLPVKYPGGFWELQPDGAEDVYFTAADGTRLHGWYAAHEDPFAVVLFAHGNAGNITHRADVFDRLHRELRCTVLMFDYRGYGKSEGSPSETGVLQDGLAAHDLLVRRAAVAPDESVLMGRSLGAAVAVELAARRGARALVLYSAFSSLPEVAAHHYWWLPVRWLMRTRFDSAAVIGNYHGPLLQAHGRDDEIIPVDLGRQLFEAAPTEQKQWFALEGLSHNDPIPHRFYEAFVNFPANQEGADSPQ